MRVVAGTAGGLRLHAPPGRALRPTSERVREAVFSSLGSIGAIDGAVVVDLFAGTGALGIEALSRGASRAVFVDADPIAVAPQRGQLEVAAALLPRAQHRALAPDLEVDLGQLEAVRRTLHRLEARLALRRRRLAEQVTPRLRGGASHPAS